MAQLDKEGALPAYRDSSGRRLFDSDLVEEYARLREAQTRQRINYTSPEETASDDVPACDQDAVADETTMQTKKTLRRLHIRVLRDNLLDADSEADGARREIDAAVAHLQDAVLRRDDLQRQLKVALDQRTRPNA